MPKFRTAFNGYAVGTLRFRLPLTRLSCLPNTEFKHRQTVSGGLQPLPAEQTSGSDSTGARCVTCRCVICRPRGSDEGLQSNSVSRTMRPAGPALVTRRQNFGIIGNGRQHVLDVRGPCEPSRELFRSLGLAPRQLLLERLKGPPPWARGRSSLPPALPPLPQIAPNGSVVEVGAFNTADGAPRWACSVPCGPGCFPSPRTRPPAHTPGLASRPLRLLLERGEREHPHLRIRRRQREGALPKTPAAPPRWRTRARRPRRPLPPPAA